MLHYTQNQLNKRQNIITSQKKLFSIFNRNIINKLINLFDDDDNITYKISNYIENERKLQGLNSSQITINNYVYGQDRNNSTLFLITRKNGDDLLHLTIHLTVRSLNPTGSGIIHISKNIYSMPKKKTPYALISIEKVKDNSLVFSIADGYDTPGMKNSNIHDNELQKEMNVIITVLNRLFDEDNKEFYIGNNCNKMTLIHNKTNAVLNNVNKHINHVTRKNKGVSIIPLSNDSNLPIDLLKRKNKKNIK